MTNADPLKGPRSRRSTASPPLPAAAASLPSRYLEQFRALMRAVTAGSPSGHVADRAAAALTLALGPGTDALALLDDPAAARCEVLGSAGPTIGMLGGAWPRRLLPELELVLETGAPLIGWPCGPDHPFAPGGSASLAPLTADGAPVGALAAFHARTASPRQAAATQEVLLELAATVSLALERERGGRFAALGGAEPESAVARSLTLGTVYGGRAPGEGTAQTDQLTLFAAVFEAIPYSLTVIGADGRVLLRNRAAQQAAAVAPGMSPVWPLTEYLSGLDLRQAGGAEEPAPPAVRRALRGEYSHDAHFRYRSPLTGEERVAAGYAAPVRRADGALLGALELTRDITDEVTAQDEREWLLAQAAAERARVQTMLDLIPNGVMAIGGDGLRLTFVNQAALALATRPGAAAGQPDTAAHAPSWEMFTATGEPMANSATPLMRALRERQVITGVEMAIRQADGRLAPVLAAAAPMPATADGAPGGAVCIFQDFAQWKEVERLKDDFLAMASHDLRTPLTVIAARAQLLRRQLLTGRATLDQAAQGLGSILDQALHLGVLADALLDVTHMQEGRFQVHPAPTDFAAILRQVTERLAPGAPSHLLELDTPPEGLTGDWD
ncbi:MAG: PAS domain-containing protein, partial [Chloroflexi bacterium]|nr:PAS domain-containing protein [Chloroflexota bacterium]